MNQLFAYLKELWRVRTPLIILFVITLLVQVVTISPFSVLARLLEKTISVAWALVLARVIIHEMHDYLHLKQLLEEQRGLEFLGSSILYGAIYLAVMLGFLLAV